MKKGFPILLSIVITGIVISCKSKTNSKAYKLTASENAICDSLQIDKSVIGDIRQHNTNTIEPFHYSLSKIITKDGEIEAEPIFLKGLVFTEKNSGSYNVVFALKDGLKKKGYSIFLLENNFGFDDKPDHIGVLKTTDKFTVLKQIATDGINYDINNDSLLVIMRQFDKKYDLELIGASGDWCEFIIHRQPADWMQLAKEVYAVCPDAVDQGAGTMEALAAEMKRTKRLYFWWD